jgi:NAD(P)-dependent dehydrogenase (short-subunit alcohol dehydrogenase family)
MRKEKLMPKTILITGASSGFGEMMAYQLADAGHTVYGSMQATTTRNADKVAKAKKYAAEKKVDLHTIELNVLDQASADAAIAQIIKEQNKLDVLIHNAGHMTFGPLEAFTPEQILHLYDVNTVGAHRLNRAALPYMRKGKEPLMIWIGSTSTRGGIPPYLGPYFAAKSGMDTMATVYAWELARWGVESVILSPGVYTAGTNHFPNAGHPEDKDREAEYANGPTRELAEQAKKGDESIQVENQDPQDIARAVVKLVATPYGKRPFRVTVDPTDGGADEINKMGDRVHAAYLIRAGMGDLLHPTPRA